VAAGRRGTKDGIVFERRTNVGRADAGEALPGSRNVGRLLAYAMFVLAAAGNAASASAATCAPEQLVHIVVANVTPGVDPAAFAAQPKALYRIGSDKLRIEEAVDAARGMHLVAVIAEPNIWIANLSDGTGKHVVDPGPTFLARAPVFVVGDASGKLAGLEFGCEADFIAANAPKPVRSEKIGDDTFDVYRVADGADAIEILERPGSAAPAFARYYKKRKLLMVLRYLQYEPGLPSRPELFTPPKVRYAEAAQH
jgi:hypothetical protein